MNIRNALKCIRILEKVLTEVKYSSDPIEKFLEKLNESGFSIEYQEPAGVQPIAMLEAVPFEAEIGLDMPIVKPAPAPAELEF